MTKLLPMRPREAPHIILASASSGSGHSQAARNLAAVFRRIDPTSTVELVNIYDFMSPLYRRIVEGGWEKASLTPGLRGIYRILHLLVSHNAMLSRILHRGFRSVARRMEAQIKLAQLHHFIALHPAAVPVGAHVKGETGCQLSVIATDFVLHNIHYHDLVDTYFVAPQSKFVGSLSHLANLQGRVTSSGIPIADSFRTLDKFQRNRDAIHESFQILVSFGACAYRASKNLPLILKLIQRTDRHVRFIVLAGHDHGFLEGATRAIRSIDASGRVKVLGYVEDTSELMGNSHLLIGKAGGLTVSEAFAAGLPTIVVDTLPGQEEYNARSVVDHGAGISTRDLTRIVQFIQENQQAEHWASLSRRILDLGRPASSQTIAGILIPPQRFPLATVTKAKKATGGL